MRYEIPDITRSKDIYIEPPAIQRHYIAIRDAMLTEDRYTVGNRQLRLLNGGFEIPISLEQCNKLLRKYDVT